MRKTSTEQFLEKLGIEVYPITIIKFLLNRRRILNYFELASQDNFKIQIKYTVDHSDCDLCNQKKDEGILCRQHTSIDRVLNTNSVVFDIDTNTYFVKNEIFRMVGNRLVIIYCPHPKLITGEITDKKVRKINPITIEDPNLHGLPQYENVKEFMSLALMDKYMTCWFNYEFTLATIPDSRDKTDWCLLPNR
jgi:hypothetical protein